MWSSLKNYSDAALLFARAALGLLVLLLHAWPKLLGGFAGLSHHPHHASGGAWVTAFAVVETLACILLILGRWARPACLALGLFVALRVSILHPDFAHFEKEFELLLFFGLLFILGPGRFSFDKA